LNAVNVRINLALEMLDLLSEKKGGFIQDSDDGTDSDDDGYDTAVSDED